MSNPSPSPQRSFFVWRLSGYLACNTACRGQLRHRDVNALVAQQRGFNARLAVASLRGSDFVLRWINFRLASVGARLLCHFMDDASASVRAVHVLVPLS
jgi:hypothetical protein